MAYIIPQMTMFDYREIEILGDLERLVLALEGIDDEALMERLEERRGQGRDDYPVRVMWNLVIAMKVFGHRSVASFRRELSRNSQLRRICGLDDWSRKKHCVPPERVFSRFIKTLEEEREALETVFARGVGELYGLLPGFGERLAGDGKYLDSYAKGPKKDAAQETDGRAESDAAYSVKEYHYAGSDGKKHVRKETHYGFKAHIICDTATELPVAYSVTKGNADEKKEMAGLLAGLDDAQRARARTLALDRGYDSRKMIEQIKSAGISPVVDIRNCWKDGEATRQYKDTDIVYNYRGEVFYCEGDGSLAKMKYEGYDKTKKCLRYSHKGKTHKLYASCDERVFQPIARDSRKWKRLYKERTSVERLNGRLDRDFMFEDHCIRGLGKMRAMVTLTLIVMNGMAAGKIKRGINDGLAAATRAGLPPAA